MYYMLNEWYVNNKTQIWTCKSSALGQILSLQNSTSVSCGVAMETWEAGTSVSYFYTEVLVALSPRARSHSDRRMWAPCSCECWTCVGCWFRSAALRSGGRGERKLSSHRTSFAITGRGAQWTPSIAIMPELGRLSYHAQLSSLSTFCSWTRQDRDAGACSTIHH